MVLILLTYRARCWRDQSTSQLTISCRAMTLGRVTLFGVMITQHQYVRSLLTAFSVNGWARQENFWLKLMIKSWKINISFHASREAEFKELMECTQR